MSWIFIHFAINKVCNETRKFRHRLSVDRATSFAERLHLGLAVIHGVRQEAESEICDGRNSPPPPQKKTFTYPLPGNLSGIGTVFKEQGDCYSQSSIEDICSPVFTGLLPKEKPPMNVVGDVGGKIAIIIVS